MTWEAGVLLRVPVLYHHPTAILHANSMQRQQLILSANVGKFFHERAADPCQRQVQDINQMTSSAIDVTFGRCPQHSLMPGNP